MTFAEKMSTLDVALTELEAAADRLGAAVVQLGEAISQPVAPRHLRLVDAPDVPAIRVGQ